LAATRASYSSSVKVEEVPTGLRVPVGDRDHDSVEGAVPSDDVVDGLPETVVRGLQLAFFRHGDHVVDGFYIFQRVFGNRDEIRTLSDLEGSDLT
jgi:hypothetical protein